MEISHQGEVLLQIDGSLAEALVALLRALLLGSHVPERAERPAPAASATPTASAVDDAIARRRAADAHRSREYRKRERQKRDARDASRDGERDASRDAPASRHAGGYQKQSSGSEGMEEKNNLPSSSFPNVTPVTERDATERDASRVTERRVTDGWTDHLLFPLGGPTRSIDAERVVLLFANAERAAEREDVPPSKVITAYAPDAEPFKATLARLAAGGISEGDFRSLIECARAGDLKPPYRGPLSLFGMLGPVVGAEYHARALMTALDIARRWKRLQVRTRAVTTKPTAAAALVGKETGLDQVREQRARMGPRPIERK